MLVADAPMAPLELVSASSTLFSFKQLRLKGHEHLGVNYPAFYSENLRDWTGFGPIKTGEEAVSGQPEYEFSLLKMDESISAGRGKLFIRSAFPR